MSKTFTVNELKIEGYVSHTSEWKKIHEKIGNSLDRYYSGERFMLQAVLTDHPISYVEVTMNGIRINGNAVSLNTNLSPTSSNALWNGSIYHQSLTNTTTRLANGPVTFTFHVLYQMEQRSMILSRFTLLAASTR